MEVNHKHVKLIAAELSYMWATYLSDSMSICVFKHFLANMEDEDIHRLTAHAIDLAQQHVGIIRGIFQRKEYKSLWGLQTRISI